MQLTDRINRIQISPTAAVIAEAEKLKSRGVDVADFGPGEPDFPTPDHIKKAAIKAIDENKTKYTATAGIMPLREAICAWHKRELGSTYEAKECVVNVGGKHSIFNLVSLLIQNGDEVIIPAPYWVSYPDIVKYAGGTPVFVQARPRRLQRQSRGHRKSHHSENAHGFCEFAQQSLRRRGRPPKNSNAFSRSAGNTKSG